MGLLKTDKEISPFLYFVPQGYQKSFLESQKLIRMILGGNFSGKTHSSLYDLVLCLTGNNHYQPNFPKPPIRARLVGNSFVKAIGEVIYPKLREMLPDNQIREKRKNQQGVVSYMLLHNGSRLDFMSNEQDDKLFEGWKGEYLLFDEPPKRAAIIASIRGLTNENCKCVFNFTPIEDVTSKVNYDQLGYLFDEYYQAAVENGGTNKNIATFNWTRLENKYSSEKMTNEFIALLRPDEIEARIYGRWQFLMGLIFTDFNKETQIIDEFDLPNDKYTKYRGMDPHSVAETGILFLAIDRDENFIVFDELYEPNMIVDDLSLKIKKKSEGHRFQQTTIDSQATERNPLTNISYLDEFRKRLGAITPARRDRRDVGITWIKGLLKKNKLFVFRRCKNFIAEMSKFRNLPQDKDHLIDCLRYINSIRAYYHDPEKLKWRYKGGYDPLYTSLEKQRNAFLRTGY